MLSDFPIVPAILVKDTPRPRRLESIADAVSVVDDALAARRTAPWREALERLKAANTEDDAIEAIGALRELLMIEDLLASSDRSRA